ncbi:M20/M25/M40 family metallo-hydrolase [Alsobacter sp. SYSU M60028]|uniref:M20/M25/M40 family metallo-hydrolase n=1 Tax=Alsobacter ponti TaxID=2962936 RepID=A0ABT1LB05_9HYPH|nr:M20/M25/M40 family metallo-hydrolase [Alsobacter ponti]MCP8938248.1 M20/M25/M40 family metallo-hydrolase [Alsobacter ponti]
MTSVAESRVLARIEQDFERAIGDIQDAIRIPGVSKSGENLEEMAAWVADYLRRLGADVTVYPGQVAPIIEGELRSPGASYTLLFYTLYDVQPANPEEWSSPPFAAEIVSDEQGQRRLVGRGTFNSKGPLIGFLAAVRAFQDAGVPLPVNLHFLIEGEEEIGSPSLEPHLRAHLDRFRRCDGAFLPYLGTNTQGVTPIRLGFKGLAFLEFSVSGGAWGGPAKHDIHAMHSGWLASPGWELMTALSTLQDRDGRLTIDGLPTPAGPDEDDRQLLAQAARDLKPETFLRELGAQRFKHGESFEGELTHFLFDPTLNVDGIWVGSTPPGTVPATHLAQRASAILDLRFVPGMEVDQTLGLIRKHLDRRGFGHVEMQVRTAYPASKCSLREPVVQALVQSCRQHSDRVTVFPLHAGAAPLYLFSEVIGIPFAFGGLGHGGRPHAPDEYLNVDSMRDYFRCVTSFLFALGGAT